MIFLQELPTLEDLGISFGGFGNIVNVISIFLVLILFIVVLGVVSYFVIMYFMFNKRIIIWEKIGNTIQITKRDKARDIKLSPSGDYVTYLKKRRIYIPYATLQTGKRTYFYYLKPDGDLMPFTLTDIDELLGKAGVHFVHPEVRMAYREMEDALKLRLQKTSFWAKYGGQIMFIGLILVTGIMMWLVMDKWIDLSASVTNSVNVAKEVMELAKEVLVSVDNIKTGGSGIQPA